VARSCHGEKKEPGRRQEMYGIPDDALQDVTAKIKKSAVKGCLRGFSAAINFTRKAIPVNHLYGQPGLSMPMGGFLALKTLS